MAHHGSVRYGFKNRFLDRKDIAFSKESLINRSFVKQPASIIILDETTESSFCRRSSTAWNRFESFDKVEARASKSINGIDRLVVSWQNTDTSRLSNVDIALHSSIN